MRLAGKGLHVFSTRKAVPYLLLAPLLSLFAVFRLWPIYKAIILSLYQWSSLTSGTFVGLENYFWVLRNKFFLIGLKNTLYYVVVYNAIMIVLALAIAVIVDSRLIRGGRVFRTIYFLPICMSLVVTAFVFQYILAPNGLLNTVLRLIPFVPSGTEYLANPDTAMGAVIMMKVVRNTGYYSVFLFAGLKAIPLEFYEASRIDGASSWAMFRYVTLPLLKPILLFVIVMSTIWAFQLFDEPWLLLKGGPVNATTTLQIFLYEQAFLGGKFGVAAAASFLMAFLMIGVSRLYIRLFKES